MDKVAIFGAAGTMGKLLGAELERRGVPFRAVGRDRRKLEAAFGNLKGAEIAPADLADPAAAEEAARGTDTILYCVGVPYTAFKLHPALMRTSVMAAAEAGVERMAVLSSVYSYGVPQTRRVDETHPREPGTVKGRYRKEQEDIALEANLLGLLKTLVVRLPDFYGPHAEMSLAHQVFSAALANKTARWLGPVSTPHEFVYVPDAAATILELACRRDCYGEAWNLGGAGEISGADFIQKVYLAAGRQPRFQSVGRFMLRIAGWFQPFMRELEEMLYLQETPVILDDAKLLATLGNVKKTPYDEGVRRTIEFMRAPRV
jgi:nucleoside-diphosphate-sugar epimerase